MDAMKSAAVATILLLTMTGAADAGQASKRDAGSCLVEVLRSEELPIGRYFTTRSRRPYW